MTMPLDPEYTDDTLVSVKEEPKGYDVGMGYGGHTHFFLPKNETGIIPEVGDRVRFYGKGIGYTIRGAAIEGKGTVFYRTEKQQQELFEQQNKERLIKKQRQLDDSREERDARINALPDLLNQRIVRFHLVRGENWRRDHETYELFVCEQAAVFYEHFKDQYKPQEKIDAWYKLDYEDQRKVIPDLSDGHSGNSMGAATTLAHILLGDEPELVIKQHGALCGLTGCEEYGCYAATKDIEAR